MTALLDDLREHLRITRADASWKREEARNLAMQVTALEAVAKRMDDECQVLEAMIAKHGIAKQSARDRLDAGGYSSRGDGGPGLIDAFGLRSATGKPPPESPAWLIQKMTADELNAKIEAAYRDAYARISVTRDPTEDGPP